LSDSIEIFKPPFVRRTVPAALAIWMTYGSQLSVLTLMPTILVAQGYTVTPGAQSVGGNYLHACL